MANYDPVEFLDRSKLDALTMEVGRLCRLASTLKIDAGMIIRDDCQLIAADKLKRQDRMTRWRRLYPVRELVYAAVTDLRAAARRLDAEWERAEDSLCALGQQGRQSRR